MIIDCFTFNKELDLLDARFEYLNDVVDYFLIVEADITFSGMPREFSYIKNISRYRKYVDKILYFPVSIDITGLDFDIRLDEYNSKHAAWYVERSQRNHFLTALRLFNDDDYVLIGDVDEIPSKSGITAMLRNLSQSMPVVVCQQQMFYYNFNRVQKDFWDGTIMTTVSQVKSQTVETIRIARRQHPFVRNGGWHLSNWMTAEEIQDKIKSFSHQEFNKEKYTDINTITKNLKEGKDFLGRSDNEFIPFDQQTLPEDFRNIFLKTVKSS
jgi:beta-1,4-mannosyl-glycoprotein beta-1,4-N-acetylglucosaminyltransferase